MRALLLLVALLGLLARAQASLVGCGDERGGLVGRNAHS